MTVGTYDRYKLLTSGPAEDPQAEIDLINKNAARSRKIMSMAYPTWVVAVKLRSGLSFSYYNSEIHILYTYFY